MNQSSARMHQIASHEEQYLQRPFVLTQNKQLMQRTGRYGLFINFAG